MKFLFKVLLAIVILSITVFVAYYTYYNLRCYKKQGVLTLQNSTITANGFLNDICLNKTIGEFTLKMPSFSDTNKSEFLAKLFAIEDLNSKLDSLDILLFDKHELKQDIEKKLGIGVKLVKPDTLYQVLKTKLKNDEILLMLDGKFTLYIPQIKKEQSLSSLAGFELTEGTLTILRRITYNLLQKLKTYPYNFTKNKLLVSSLDLAKYIPYGRLVNLGDLDKLLQDNGLDINVKKEILFLFVFMKAYGIKTFWYPKFPYTGFIR